MSASATQGGDHNQAYMTDTQCGSSAVTGELFAITLHCVTLHYNTLHYIRTTPCLKKRPTFGLLNL